MTRRQLYFLALFLGLAGQGWILYSYKKLEKQEEAFNTCMFKRVTGLPCPSCGTVHSIVSIVHGDVRTALRENPLGFAGILLVAVVPYWILFDMALGWESCYRFFLAIERQLKKPWILFPFLGLILLIWLYKLGNFFSLF